MEPTYSKIGTILDDYCQVSFGRDVRLSPACSICGVVSVGNDVTVFAGTQIRGDCAPISIGDGTNVQENCCLHVSAATSLSIGSNVTVGHGAILHGCTIENDVLIGMGAIVLDRAHISEHCLVGAGALVTEDKDFPPRSLIIGSPARAVRQLTDEEVAQWVDHAGQDYVEVGDRMLKGGLLLSPPEDAHIWPLA